jgi:hypothetical protein
VSDKVVGDAATGKDNQTLVGTETLPKKFTRPAPLRGGAPIAAK